MKKEELIQLVREELESALAETKDVDEETVGDSNPATKMTAGEVEKREKIGTSIPGHPPVHQKISTKKRRKRADSRQDRRDSDAPEHAAAKRIDAKKNRANKIAGRAHRRTHGPAFEGKTPINALIEQIQEAKKKEKEPVKPVGLVKKLKAQFGDQRHPSGRLVWISHYWAAMTAIALNKHKKGKKPASDGDSGD